MRSILKAAFTILSTLAIANVMAQCGPGGCGFQGGNNGYNYPASYSGSYSRGSTNPGYYDQQGRQYHGYAGYQGQDWHDNHDGRWGQQQDWGHDHQDWGHDHAHQGWGHDQQGWGHDHAHQDWGHGQQAGHDGQHGYDYPVADHPVTDHNGQHIRYYGKPGPDYNQGLAQPGMQPAQPGMQPAQQATQKTSYNSYSSKNDWGNLANADRLNGESVNGGGSTKAPTPKPAPTDETRSAPSSHSW